ncbi:MAG: hypothetical protein CMJ86_11225 [Planctomycetes bacterium]|nr:hypothetical protein [Planctomycetota bacterium]
MHILALCAVPPWPALDGGRRRTLELLSALAQRIPVTLCAVEDPGPHHDLPVAANAFQAVHIFPRSPLPPGVAPLAARPERWFHSQALKTWLAKRDHSSRFSALFLDEPWLLRTVPRRSPPILAHHHKLEVELARELQHPWHERLRVERLERMVALRARTHVFASQEDRTRFLGRHPKARVRVLPAGVDPRRFVVPEADRDRNRLLFFGSLNYEPNRRALAELFRNHWPHIHQQHPQLVLEVVGAGEAPELCEGRPDGVEWVGYVPDPLPYLQHACALLAPIPIAGGARQKMVEALATGCPIIATERAAEGLPQAKDWLQLTQPGEAFEHGVLEHLANPEPGFERSLRAAEWVRRHFSWDALAGQLEGFLG